MDPVADTRLAPLIKKGARAAWLPWPRFRRVLWPGQLFWLVAVAS